MHRFKIEDLLKIFKNTFKKLDHKYPTKFSFCNYSLKKHFLSSSKFAIFYREPRLWNKILINEEKKWNLKYYFKKEQKQNCLMWKMNFLISNTRFLKIMNKS